MTGQWLLWTTCCSTQATARVDTCPLEAFIDVPLSMWCCCQTARSLLTELHIAHSRTMQIFSFRYLLDDVVWLVNRAIIASHVVAIWSWIKSSLDRQNINASVCTYMYGLSYVTCMYTRRHTEANCMYCKICTYHGCQQPWLQSAQLACKQLLLLKPSL